MGNVDARGKPQSDYQTVNDMESMTVQSDAVEADIKTILTRHGVSGIVEHLNQSDLVFGDASDITDYADAMRQMKEAEEVFMQLPSKVREVFDHDVAKYLDSANDGLSDVQREKLIKLGYLEAPEVAPEVPPAPVEPVAPEPPAE